MIEVINLSKSFKKPIRQPGLKGMIKTLFSLKYEETKAVKDISFNIKPGEMVGYIGANGAGKSTTIKMMCGILTPTSGKVLINGKEPYNSKSRTKVLKNIGVVFGQRTQLWWDLPLIETYKLLQLVYEISDEDYNSRFNYLCELLELNKFLSSPVRTLSLGQRMRADLAASILHNPGILFLDEPTIGLDVLVKEKIIEAIKTINKKYNTTVILTTHDMNDITNLCNRVIIIDEGTILFDGPLTEIKNKFGDIRHIYITSKERINLEELNNLFNNKLVFEIVDHSLEITFDTKDVLVNNILKHIFTNYNITDFKITENTIQHVVKRIYETKRV